MHALLALFLVLLFLVGIALLVAGVLGSKKGKKNKCCYKRCCGCKWVQRNLLSNVAELAQATDPDVIAVTAVVPEPCEWSNGASSSSSSARCGCSSSSSSSTCLECKRSKFWAALQGSGEIVRYALHDGSTGSCRLQTVLVPAAVEGPGSPTSLIVNPSGQCSPCGGSSSSSEPSGFVVADVATGPAMLIGTTADGTVFGFNNDVNPTGAITVISNPGAVYVGVARCGSNLFVANFFSGQIEAYDNQWSFVTSFTDAALTAIGYAPSNLAIIDGFLYVLFAQQNQTLNGGVAGVGNGFIDVFSIDGTLVKRLVNRGALNLPSSISVLCKELLVTNQGDGKINRFDRCTGQLLGPLTDCCKNPILLDGVTSIAQLKRCKLDKCGRCIEDCPPKLCKNKLIVGSAPVDGTSGLITILNGAGPH